MNTSISPDFAGRIHLRLDITDGHVSHVDVESTRPKGVSKVFAGRSPDETVRVLGLIFSLCSTAQSMASLGAIEQALGIRVSKSEQAARDILREAEMLTQTVMRISMDWPKMLGFTPHLDMARAAMSAQGEIEQALYGGANWKHIGGAGLTPDVLGVGDHLSNLQSTLYQHLYGEGFADQLLSALDELQLNAFGALASDEQPETGALMRHWDAAQVVKAREAYGAGLRARFVSRLVDIEDLPKSQMALLDRLGPCDPASPTTRKGGVGEVTVETARGALHHKVEIKDGLISGYEIFAPTDVNFETDGVVAMGLRGVEAADEEALKRAAELHVLAVDPCVKCELEIFDA